MAEKTNPKSLFQWESSSSLLNLQSTQMGKGQNLQK